MGSASAHGQKILPSGVECWTWKIFGSALLLLLFINNFQLRSAF